MRFCQCVYNSCVCFHINIINQENIGDSVIAYSFIMILMYALLYTNEVQFHITEVESKTRRVTCKVSKYINII